MALSALPSAAPSPVDLRARARGRLARQGPAECGDADLLALATGCRLPLAAELLEHVGGSSGLCGASVSELVHAGLSPSRAVAAVAAFELARRARDAPRHGTWRIRTPTDLAERFVAEMGGLEREELRVVLLNTKNAVSAVVTVYRGNLAGSPVRVGEVFRDAVRRHAAAIAVIHNHPSGDPAPSGEDVRITRELAAAGRLLDIELLDHLIVAHDRWVSMRAIGAL
jgi:DNA repair protein RadC